MKVAKLDPIGRIDGSLEKKNRETQNVLTCVDVFSNSDNAFCKLAPIQIHPPSLGRKFRSENSKRPIAKMICSLAAKGMLFQSSGGLTPGAQSSSPGTFHGKWMPFAWTQ